MQALLQLVSLNSLCRVDTASIGSTGSFQRKDVYMADLDGSKAAKDYHVDTPFANDQGFM